VIRTLSQLAAQLPQRVVTFEGSAYPLPVCQAILGRLPVAGELRRMLPGARDRGPGHVALRTAMASECYEAARPDAVGLFIRDSRLRDLVFMGGNWRAGWAFLLGSQAQALSEALQEREFIVRPPRPTRGAWTNRATSWPGVQSAPRAIHVRERARPGRERRAVHD